MSNARGFKDVSGIVGRAFPVTDDSLLADLLRWRKPTIRSDILQDGHDAGVLGGLRLRAWIGVPLVVRGQVRGVLAMGKAKPSHYSEDDLQNAMAFANQAAVAIENAVSSNMSVSSTGSRAISWRASPTNSARR